MCFWRPVGVRAGEVGAPLESVSDNWTDFTLAWALDERFSGLAERMNAGEREADFGLLGFSRPPRSAKQEGGSDA